MQMQLSSDVRIPDGLLAANALLAENSRQGFGTSTHTLYQGFGVAISSTALGISGTLYDGRVRCRYTGKERDAESGLDNFGARYFGSSMGRFMSPDYSDSGFDPVAVPSADFENPQSLNLYSYVHNNPLTNADPDGHDCINTSNLQTDGTVTVTAGTSCASDPAKYGTYVDGTVNPNSITQDSHGDVGYSYSNYADGSGSSGTGVITQAVPYGPLDGPANQAGLQTIGAADKLVTNAAFATAGVYGVVGAAAAAPEAAAAIARNGIKFALQHGMRWAADHSMVMATASEVKAAVGAAVASGIASGEFQQGVIKGQTMVNGTIIAFTGFINSANQVTISNVMGGFGK
jgi:RHS repeat-associated protein